MSISVTLAISAPSTTVPFQKLVIAETEYETTDVSTSNLVYTTTSIISGTPPNTSYITQIKYADGVNYKWYAVRWVAIDGSYTDWSNRAKLIHSTLRYRIARRLKSQSTDIGDSDWDDIINSAEADLMENETSFDGLSNWHQGWFVRRGQRHALEEITSKWITSFNIGSGSKRLDMGAPIFSLQRQIEQMDNEWHKELERDDIQLINGHWVAGGSALASYTLLWQDSVDEIGVDYGVTRRQSYLNSDILLDLYPDESDTDYSSGD